jgi:hypothetical protein
LVHCRNENVQTLLSALSFASIRFCFLQLTMGSTPVSPSCAWPLSCCPCSWCTARLTPLAGAVVGGL